AQASGRSAALASQLAGMATPFSVADLGSFPADGSTRWLGARSEAWLRGLHPVSAAMFRQIIGEARAIYGIEGYIRDGFRDYAGQAGVPSGNTQVPPGGSFHQFGRAIDFTVTNTERFGGVVAAYERLGDIARSH